MNENQKAFIDQLKYGHSFRLNGKRIDPKDFYMDKQEFASPGLQPANGCIPTYPSMTLRDYFAAKAMQGFAAAPDTGEIGSFRIAILSYEFADQMMIARAMTPGEVE